MKTGGLKDSTAFPWDFWPNKNLKLNINIVALKIKLVGKGV